MYYAITRAVSPAINQCELSYQERTGIDPGLAEKQHLALVDKLRELGCHILSLAAEAGLPDSVFVEDCAVVLDEVAIITRPGAASRRPETETIARALKPFRHLHYIRPPATLDGGDVLLAGRQLYVGLSSRTNEQAIDQLRVATSIHGYTVSQVEFTACLHLKSAVTQVAEDLLLINPDWVDPAQFAPLDCLAVAHSEPHAANVVLLDDRVIMPKKFHRTRKRLQARGIDIETVTMTELAKAEGGVSCCSLLFQN